MSRRDNCGACAMTDDACGLHRDFPPFKNSADFVCPDHGHFVVSFDGAIPDEAKCMTWLAPSTMPYPTSYCGQWSPRSPS